jgi:hypothetical protein
MVRTLDIVEGDTLDTIYSVFAWSLDALSQGEFPYNDHLGVPFSSIHHPDRFAKRGQKLADGRVGAFAGMRGDWKYLVEALHLPRFYKHHDYLCHACCVRKYANGMRYTDFRRCAPHRATILSNMEFLGDLLGRTVISPLLLIPGFHVARIHFDVMHCLDLGLLQYLVPSVLKHLVQEGAFAGSNLALKFASAYAAYRLWCEINKVRDVIRQKFKPGVWMKGTGFPKITQATSRAGCLRSMMYWLLKVCRDHTATASGKMRLAMVEAWIEFDVLCRKFPRHLTSEQHAELCQALERALVCYNALADLFVTLKRKLYKIIPKCHALTHTYDSPLNPREVQCYQDEDMVKRLKKIFNNVHGGVGASARGLWRYSILVGLRWWEELRVLRGIPAFHRDRFGIPVQVDDSVKQRVLQKQSEKTAKRRKFKK